MRGCIRVGNRDHWQVSARGWQGWSRGVIRVSLQVDCRMIAQVPKTAAKVESADVNGHRLVNQVRVGAPRVQG